MPGSETADARSGTVVGDRQGQQFAAIRTLRPCRFGGTSAMLSQALID